ncbi:MAG: hypothetical protein ACR2P5_03935 [Gammaproteobacteria bacterium]
MTEEYKKPAESAPPPEAVQPPQPDALYSNQPALDSTEEKALKRPELDSYEDRGF